MRPSGRLIVGCAQDQFIEKGGRFFVCPICFGERDLDARELVETAKLKGRNPRPWSSRAEGR
jgi:hypothetical protein